MLSLFQARKCKSKKKTSVKGKCLKKCAPGQRRRKRKPRTCYWPKKKRTTVKRRKRCSPKDAVVVGYTAKGSKIYQGPKGGEFFCHKGSRIYLKDCARSPFGPCKNEDRSGYLRPSLCKTSKLRPGSKCIARTRANMVNPGGALRGYGWGQPPVGAYAGDMGMRVGRFNRIDDPIRQRTILIPRDFGDQEL